jgi:POT family proton-dependent oligopeptide transporter
MESSRKTFFGHPRGLATLFMTELWERFSYYGMRALLVLFMTDTARGGLGMDTQTSAAIYGLYTFGVYALALPGGWLADRVLGQRKAVLYGGIVIALGHYTLAIPTLWAFYAGLCLVALGTGLLKPNVSAIVADLYPEGGGRRDAGFSIFYMGINLGAILGQGICPLLGEKVSWHLGFGAAGIGMTLGLVQYVHGAKHLGDAGVLRGEATERGARASAVKRFAFGVVTVVVLALGLVGLSRAAVLPITLVGFVQATGVIVAILAALYFAFVIVVGCRDADERKRVGLIAVLFLGAAIFWSGFEQAGSSMNLFARDYTDRSVFGWEAPAGWLQEINPILIVLLAPVMGALWVRLGDRNPSIGVKFGLGLVFLAIGFLVLAWGSQHVGGGKVSPMWLVVTYFFHTVGELMVSPVGLSSVTKLSPQRLVGQMMGTWFIGAALGNLIAGLVAGYIETMPMPALFATVAALVGGFGLVFVLLARPIRWLGGGIK